MLTTSSRLQHLDAHFSSLRTRQCKNGPAKPFVVRTQTAPAQLRFTNTPDIAVTPCERTSSRSSTSSEPASFHSAVETRDMCAKKYGKRNQTPSPLRKSRIVTTVEEVPLDRMTTNDDVTNNDHALAPQPISPVAVDLPAPTPKESSPTSERNLPRTSRDHRRTSTISEPLPRSAIPRRKSSTQFRRNRRGQDLISFHQDSCRLFQSLEGTISGDQFTTRARPALSRPCSLPASRAMSFSQETRKQAPSSLEIPISDDPTSETTDEIHIPSSRSLSLSLPAAMELDDTNGSASRRAPRTVLSWTSAESRKREYDKIDQAHSGFRGLWKKVTPKWCHGRGTRRKFFEEGKEDGDSVRRYRVDLTHDVDETGDRWRGVGEMRHMIGRD